MADDYSQSELEKTARSLGISTSLLKGKAAPKNEGEYSDEDLAATAKDIGINFGAIGKDLPPRAPLRITVRPGGPHFDKVSGAIDQAVQSVPVAGPALEAMSNVAASAIQPAVRSDVPNTFQGRFNQNESDLAAARHEFSEQNPALALGSNLAGGMVGGGAMATTRLGKVALGLTGPSLGIRTVAGAGGQGGIAATDAMMRGNDVVPQAAMGAAGGAAGPLAGTALEHAGNLVSTHLWPKKGPLKGFSPLTVNRLTGALEGETQASIADAKNRMGPAGFLGDLNQGMTDLAGGVADIPGIGKTIVRSAYGDRMKDQINRLKVVLDRTMGPERNIPLEMENITKTAKATYDPLYEKFRSMAIIPTPELKSLVPRLEESHAFTLANELAGITGKPKIKPDVFKTDGVTTSENWDLIKRGLDRRINQAYKQEGGDTLAKALTGLKHEMIDEIEKTPAGKVWADARNKFATKESMLEEIQNGVDTFIGGRNATTKDELREELKRLSTPEKLARQVGLRSAIGEAIGKSLTGDTRARNLLLAPNNQEKIRLIVNDPALAEHLIASLKQEHYLGDKSLDVLGNLATGASASARTARRDALMPEPTKSDWDLMKPMTYIPPSIREQFTIAGMANALKGSRAAKSQRELAEVLTMPNNPTMSDLVDALRNEGARQAKVSNRLGTAGAVTTGVVSGPATSVLRLNREDRNRLPFR
jgi:hypothetical protein